MGPADRANPAEEAAQVAVDRGHRRGVPLRHRCQRREQDVNDVRGRGRLDGADGDGCGPSAAAGRTARVVEAPGVEAPAAASGGPLTSLSEGTYEVGTGDGQIAPGKYKSPGPPSGSQCYYARLSSDTTTDIIANDLKQGPMTMTVQSSDKYVEINGCTFTKA